MGKALIFGTDGFVGKYMADELKSHGYDIYGAGQNAGKSHKEYSIWYSCDLLDGDDVKNIIAEVNPTCIINLAGQSNVGISWKIPRRTFEVNVCGAINILESVVQCGTDCDILMIGSSEEYDISEAPLNEQSRLNPSNPYAISKMALESFCDFYRRRYGMKIHFMRAFNHTGIGQTDNFVIPSWCKQVAEISQNNADGDIRVGNLNIKRDFSNVKDIVRAYRMIIESDDYDVTYNVGSGDSIELQKILEYIISLSTQKVSIKVDEHLIRPVENPVIHCDNSLLKKRLGWKPEYDIYMTVREIYEYYLHGGAVFDGDG